MALPVSRFEPGDGLQPRAAADPLPYLNPVLLAAAERYAKQALSASTRSAYAKDWRRFRDWCDRHGALALPATPQLLAQYLADAAGTVSQDGRPAYSPSTLSRWTSSINSMHSGAGLTAPGRHRMVQDVLKGIRSERSRPPKRSQPLLLDDIRTLLAAMPQEGWPDALSARRDSLVLLIGFAGAFRRSEVAALMVSDVRLHRLDGLHVMLRRSKTDQDAQGHTKGIPYGASHETCPPCAYVRWRQVVDASDSGGRSAVMRALRSSGPHTGHVCRIAVLPSAPGDDARPLLRPIGESGTIGSGGVTGHSINLWVKARAQLAGYETGSLTGHSLRVGFVSQAVRNGADGAAIRRQTLHKTMSMIDLYTRELAPLEANAVTEIGL